MSTPGRPQQSEGTYAKLVDDEGSYDQLSGRTQGGLAAHLGNVVHRLRGLGTLRLAIICLAALCAILLISIISMAAHNKNKAQGGGDAVAGVQKQKQGVNVSALVDSISKLQQEKKELQGEKEELQKAKEEVQRAKEEQQKANQELQSTNQELQRAKEEQQRANQELQRAKEEQQRENQELQRANQELQRANQELQARLAATKAPDVIKPTSAPIVCPNDEHLFNSSCYFISRTTRDWPESKSFCESQGAHLAIIETAEEQTFLWDLLPRGHWNSFWFGLTDEHTEDVWKWVDGRPLVGGFWEVGEPNNHIDEDCGYIVKTTVLERVAIRSWYDAPCDMYLPFICEKYMGPGASTAIPH